MNITLTANQIDRCVLKSNSTVFLDDHSLNQSATMNPPQLIAQSLVWDNHVCVSSKVGSRWIDDLERARRAGFSFVSVNVGDGHLGLDRVIRLLADFRDWVGRHDDHFVMAATAQDVIDARNQGKTAIAFDLEGAYSLEGQINLVPLLYDLGVRWMLFAYNRSNWAAGGCHDDGDVGLSTEGVRLLREMDRVGMVKCCSHTNYRAARDVLEYSETPVVFSHSNARALCPHPRNIPDHLARACAASGGVIGLNGLDIFLGEGDDLVSLLIDHINYLVQLLGPEHVGLGLDYVLDMEDLNAALAESEATWPPEYGYGPDIRFIQPEQLSEIVAGMQGRGYSPADIQAVLGGNFLRVAQQVWRS